MARYIMANRRAGKFLKEEKLAARDTVNGVFDRQFASTVDIVGDTAPEDEQARRIIVFDAEPAEIEATMASMPSDVMLEPEILHSTSAITINTPADLTLSDSSDIAEIESVAASKTLSITVTSDGQPVNDAQVILFLRGFNNSTDVTRSTDNTGQVQFEFLPFFVPAALIILPAGGFWSFVVRGPVDGANVEIPALPGNGPLEWWHNVMNVTSFDLNRGEGIRVGVLDTGVGPHKFLNHVNNAGAFINGVHIPDGGQDVDSHGSHVCGTIAARPENSSGDYSGIAPGVELISARVFPPNSGANQGDIANAIDFVSRELTADLINMSLGSELPSQIELDSITDALERGTLCVCAAGNSSGAVSFPARFSETIAVSAIGLLGWGPDGSMAATRLPADASKNGIDNLYLSDFSCFGPEIDCCAPGVGIISTVPERFGLSAPYLSMDGTSMASPAACGAVAAILSVDQNYRALPRNTTRAEMARSLLRAACKDIGLHSDFQGRGMPQVS